MRIPRRAAGSAILVLVGGGLLATVVSTGWIDVVRDTYHWRCEYQSDGEYSDWVCADGIGYLMPLVAIALMHCALMVAAIIVVLVARRHAAVWRALPLLLAGPIAIFGAVTLLAAGNVSQLSVTQTFGVGSLAVAAVLGTLTAVGPPRAVVPLLTVALIAGVVSAALMPATVSLVAMLIATGVVAGLTRPRPAAV